MSNMHDDKRPPDSITFGNMPQDGIAAALHNVESAHQQALSLLQQTELAYGRLIPRQLLTLLERNSIVDVKLGDQVERQLTIMFSDIRNFTPLSESMTPGENLEFINSYLSQMEPVISEHHGIIDKYMGDAIMALFLRNSDDALTGSIAMLEKLNHYNAGRARAGYEPTQIGIGLNTGIVMIGMVGGANRMDSTVIGDAVNLTSRIEEATKTYHVPLLISQNTLYDLIDPAQYDFRFLDRIRVKGKIQPLSIFEVFNSDSAELRQGKRTSKVRFEKAIAHYHLKHIPHAIELLERCIQIAPDDIPAQIYLARCEEFLNSGQHISTGELDTCLEWRNEFKIGITGIDASHARLFKHTNAFIESAKDDRLGSVRAMLDFLSDYAHSHFEPEEELMRRHNYPFLDSHMQEHARCMENFTALKNEAAIADSDPLHLSFRTQLLLLDWFSGHIAKTDRHMARHLLPLLSAAA